MDGGAAAAVVNGTGSRSATTLLFLLYLFHFPPLTLFNSCGSAVPPHGGGSHDFSKVFILVLELGLNNSNPRMCLGEPTDSRKPLSWDQ